MPITLGYLRLYLSAGASAKDKLSGDLTEIKLRAFKVQTRIERQNYCTSKVKAKLIISQRDQQFMQNQPIKLSFLSYFH